MSNVNPDGQRECGCSNDMFCACKKDKQKTRCGCHIPKVWKNQKPPWIVYCPLHAHAFELLAALKQADALLSDFYRTIDKDHFYRDRLVEVNRTVREAIAVSQI